MTLWFAEVDRHVATEVAVMERSSIPGDGPIEAGETIVIGCATPSGTTATAVAIVGACWPPTAVEVSEGLPGWTAQGEVGLVCAEEDPAHAWLWGLTQITPIPLVRVETLGSRLRRHRPLKQASSDLAEGLACGVTAVSIWDYLRVGRSVQGVLERIPPWALPWAQGLANELEASAELELSEVMELVGAADDGPGPYQSHVRDVLSGNHGRMLQRIWARLRPSAEIPQRPGHGR